MRAASEEYIRVIISRESHESRKILLYAFGGIGGICVSKKPRTLHADVPTSSPLIAHRSSLISVPLKILYKTVFLYKSSWKVESAQLENFYFQLENYFFSVGKSKFRSRAKWDDYLGLFLNCFKRFLFILEPCAVKGAKVKMFDIER